VTPRCQLVRRERRDGARRGTVLALHGDGGDARTLWPLCEALGTDFDAVALQAPRARDPFHASAAPDDPRWRAYAGYSWFRRDELGRLEPASFGDSLAQLESLAQELSGPLFLVGHGDGATLARGAALAFPELLAAVVAIGGDWPRIPGWSDLLAHAGESVRLLELSDSDPFGAADRVHAFLETRREGAQHGRSRSQEADQDLLQAHRYG
jgi:predicted esterase